MRAVAAFFLHNSELTGLIYSRYRGTFLCSDNSVLMYSLSRNSYKSDVNSHLKKVQNLKNTIESIPFNFSSYVDFEHLAISAHHYADIITSFIDRGDNLLVVNANDFDNVVRTYERELLELRKQIFLLATNNIEAIRASLVAWETDSEGLSLLYRQQVKGASDSDEKDVEATGERRKRIRSVLVEEFLMMLKKAAESGNDLFVVSKKYEDKTTVANKVFTILNVSRRAVTTTLVKHSISPCVLWIGVSQPCCGRK